jgi:hypothetical protein
MTRYMRNTVTGAIVSLSDDDDDGYQALVTQKQSSGQGAGVWPLYEETSSADAADESPLPLESGSGGSVDLSAVDQDVVVVNDHLLRLTGDVEDTAAGVTLGWDTAGAYALRYVGAVPNGETDVRFEAPGEPDTYLQVSVSPSSIGLLFHVAGVGGAGNLEYDATNGLFISDDVAFAGAGPVLSAPDNSKHRLIVANDGTLSTEPVV